MNDNIRIILDKHMMDNVMTIGLSPNDLVRFIKSTNHDLEIVDLTPAAPDDATG